MFSLKWPGNIAIKEPITISQCTHNNFLDCSCSCIFVKNGALSGANAIIFAANSLQRAGVMSIFREEIYGRCVCKTHFVCVFANDKLGQPFLICEHATVNFPLLRVKYIVFWRRATGAQIKSKKFCHSTEQRLQLSLGVVERDVKCGCSPKARLPREPSEFEALRRILADGCRRASLYSGFAPGRTHLSSPQDAFSLTPVMRRFITPRSLVENWPSSNVQTQTKCILFVCELFHGNFSQSSLLQQILVILDQGRRYFK